MSNHPRRLREATPGTGIISATYHDGHIYVAKNGLELELNDHEAVLLAHQLSEAVGQFWAEKDRATA